MNKQQCILSTSSAPYTSRQQTKAACCELCFEARDEAVDVVFQRFHGSLIDWVVLSEPAPNWVASFTHYIQCKWYSSLGHLMRSML
jgi:hypothetical protein